MAFHRLNYSTRPICCASQTTCYIGKCKIYRPLSRSCSVHVRIFSYPTKSKFNSRNGYKKFMTYFLCLFHSLFFKMHVKQTPQKSDSVVSVLLVHIMFILMAIRIIQVLFPTLRLSLVAIEALCLRRSRLISHRNLKVFL